jgi:hypothetical protein
VSARVPATTLPPARSELPAPVVGGVGGVDQASVTLRHPVRPGLELARPSSSEDKSRRADNNRCCEAVKAISAVMLLSAAARHEHSWITMVIHHSS